MGGARIRTRNLRAGYGSGINWRDTGINPSMSVPVGGNPDPDLESKGGSGSGKNGRAFKKNTNVKLK